MFVAYYRVSTPKQGRSGLGLEAQRQAVHAHLGHAPDHEFVEVETGKRNDRHELHRALNLAELTKGTLIVAKLDRLSRDAEFLNRLTKTTIKIIFADMPFADRFMIGIMAQIAQWEREQISDRTKAALAAIKARGVALGGDRGNLPATARKAAQVSAQVRSRAAQERRAKVMPYIEEARTNGRTSLRQIASFLNDHGIKTVRGNAWGVSAVRDLLAA